jgi:hypothetical protein
MKMIAKKTFDIIIPVSLLSVADFCYFSLVLAPMEVLEYTKYRIYIDANISSLKSSLPQCISNFWDADSARFLPKY